MQHEAVLCVVEIKQNNTEHTVSDYYATDFNWDIFDELNDI